MPPGETHSPNIGETVVFGFGPQGRAQALNLRDSGVPVSVFLRAKSPHLADVNEEGISHISDPSEAARKADNAILLIPDSEQPRFYRDHLHESLPEGAALIFAHGFAVHYGRIKARENLDVILAAPLAHGDLLRSDFVDPGAVPCVLAVHQDATGRAWERAEGYGRAIAGSGPFIRSTFREEVETDLFAEQAVLTGGMPELVRAAFETLVDNGYNEDIAYISCLRELRAIVDLLMEGSIAGMRERISETARYGSVTRGPRIIDADVRRRLKEILDEIRTGEFASELSEDEVSGFKKLKDASKRDASHAIEGIHKRHAARR